MRNAWTSLGRWAGVLAIGVGAFSGCAVRDQPVPVLMLHRVADDRPGDLWTLSTAEFIRLLDELEAAGFTPVWPSEIGWRGERRRSPVSRPILLTFDDGDRSLLTTVEPELRRRGYRAMVYISTALTAATEEGRLRDAEREYLTWPEIRALRGRGCLEFGGHGHRHVRAEELSDPAAEVAECVAQFERHAGYRPTSYSYPFGQYTPDLVAALKQAGFTTAVTCTERLAYGGETKPFKIPRFWVRGVGVAWDPALLDGGGVKP